MCADFFSELSGPISTKEKKYSAVHFPLWNSFKQNTCTLSHLSILYFRFYYHVKCLLHKIEKNYFFPAFNKIVKIVSKKENYFLLDWHIIRLKRTLLGLRQFLATERSLKMMKNVFNFTFNFNFALFVLKFLSSRFDHVEKLVSLPYFLHDFWRKVFLLLYSISWSKFILPDQKVKTKIQTSWEKKEL